MIEPVVYYAPAVLCARTDSAFEKQDKLLARAARLALHIPKTISINYVQKRANITPSKDRTMQLAIKYLGDSKRSQSVKDMYQQGMRRETSQEDKSNINNGCHKSVPAGQGRTLIKG